MSARAFLAASMILMLAACASRGDVAAEIARPAGLRPEVIAAGRFDLAAYVRTGAPGEPLAVYLEGDGYAWITASRPSNDPTPRDPLGLRLAAADPRPNLLWLARPCQYRGGDQARGCSTTYWTDARFSPEVVESLSLAIDSVKARAGASRIRLFGYSGGGTLAALLAARRSDVDMLVTAAAILDVGAWTAGEGLSPLLRSLDPAREADRLRGVRQVHFAGAADKAVPPAYAARFAARFGEGQAPPVAVLDGHDHACCWASQWRDLLGRAEREARQP